MTGILIERILGRCMAVFTIVFALQAVPAIATQNVLPLEWKIPILVVLYGSLCGIVVTGLRGRMTAAFARFAAIAYLIALILFPVVAVDPTSRMTGRPWIWYLLDLAIAAAVFGYSTFMAGVYTAVVPSIYFVVSQTPVGGGSPPRDALLESAYAFLLGVAVYVLVVLLRRAAATVDEAQAKAVERYSEAVHQHALEKERVEVDAIVHDGVLTTLLQAGKAETEAARILVADMARISMGRLTEAATSSPADDRPVALTTLHDRLADELERLDPRAVITPRGDIPAMLLPTDVAETLFSAASQALVNSCQHAGPEATRRVRIRVVESVAEIAIIDDGVGFDTGVPSERLGVRVSILERVRTTGGDASIRSRLGMGTVVTLRWTSEIRALESLRA